MTGLLIKKLYTKFIGLELPFLLTHMNTHTYHYGFFKCLLHMSSEASTPTPITIIGTRSRNYATKGQRLKRKT